MSDPEPGGIPGGDFRLFAQKIAMQGFYALGMFEIPGQPRPKMNLGLCRAVIDDLLLLREKTEGNLAEGERQTLDKYISDLQLSYLEREKAAGAG